MKEKYWVLIFVVVVMGLVGCKTEYDKLRASGDTELVYKKAMEYYNKKDYLKAQTLIEQIMGRYRGRKEAEDLYVKYAYTHYHMSNYILAASYFQNFANTYITSPLREEAAYMSAYSNYLQSPDYKLEQGFTTKAIDEMQNFVNTYPKSDRLKEANKLIDELRSKLEKKAFEESMLYYNLKNYQSATNSLNNMLKDFPDSDNIEQIRYYIVKSNYDLAENSIYTKRLERYESTQLAAELYLSKFTRSKNRREIDGILKSSKQIIKSLENDGYQDKSSRDRS